MALNPMGKARPSDNPYLVVRNGGITYKVLKAYSADPDKLGARWLLATASPETYGLDEYGDGYIADVSGTIISRDPLVPDSALPQHLLDPSIPAPKSPMALMFGE